MRSVWMAAPFFAAISAACSGEAQPVRIGITAWPGYELLHLAQEDGLFASEGVEVHLVEAGSCADVRRAFERGRIDGMPSTLGGLLVARDRPARLPAAVLIVDVSDGADQLLAAPRVKDVRDLRGRRVGMSETSLNTQLLARALELNGMTLDDIVRVRIEPQDMDSALASHEVDAVSTYVPHSVHIVEAGHARPIFTSAEIPGEIVDVLSFDERFLETRPDDAIRVSRAFFRALESFQARPDRAMAIMSAREGISVQAFRSIFENGVRLVSLGRQEELFTSKSLRQGLESADRILRMSKDIAGATRVEGAFSRVVVERIEK